MEKPNTHILTVIGCGDALSSGGNTQTCFHMASPEGSFLIDCGSGALAGLKKHDIDVGDIDTIVISHFHGDHYGGLPYLLLDAAIQKRQEPLTIVSPPGAPDKLRRLTELLYPGTPILEKLDLLFVPYQEEEEIKLPYLTIIPIPVVHKIESRPYGVQINTAQKVIGYSGDTGWSDQLLKIAAGTDLFICECSFYSTAVNGHLNYLRLAEYAARINTKKILLTHFDEEMLTHLDEVELPYAYDGLRLLL